MGASSTHGPGATPAGRGSRRSRLGKRTWVALAATITLAMGITIPALAVVTGSPSGFESSDGNMTADATADWNCFANGNSPGFTTSGTTTGPGTCNVVKANALAIHPDANNGTSGEVAWKSGQKLDTNCPVLLTKSSVPSKDDFTGIASYAEVDSSNPPNTFLYGAEIRAVANGSSSGNLELNQTSGTSGCPINRMAGDRLLAFDFTGGGTTLDFHALTWITIADPTAGGNNGTCNISHDSPPCWGANVISSATGIKVGGCGTTGNDVEGCSNQSEIIPAKNGIDGTDLVANRFAEFGVNLTKVLGLTGCSPFTQQVWESRSSGSSFTSNPEDIEIEHHPIENCGEIRIIKRTDPRGINQNFGFSSDLPSPGSSSPPSPNCTQSFANPSSFTLNDNANTTGDSAGNTQDCTSVVQGTYHVTEGTEPGGFTFENLTCSADATSGSSVTKSGETATITLKPLGLVTCVYVNQQNVATLSTQVSPGPVFPGTPVTDTATVKGNQAGDTPQGDVTFYLCGPLTSPACDGTTNVGTKIGTGTLSGSGGTASATSPAVNTSGHTLTPGLYCFRATWPGDSNYPGTLTEFGGPNGTNECFTVTTIATTTVTAPSAGQGGTTSFGSLVTDTATVTAASSGDGFPSGSVAFFICDPAQVIANGGTCSTGGTPFDTEMTADLGTSPPSSTATSTAIMANKTGTWCFAAAYTPGPPNGANYTGSSDATKDECFTVTDTSASVSAQDWVPNDTATITSAHHAPLNGTLSVQLYNGGSCASGMEVGAPFTETLTNATSPVTFRTNNTTKITASGTTTISWLVTFTSSDPNVTSSFSDCEVSTLNISN